MGLRNAEGKVPLPLKIVLWVVGIAMLAACAIGAVQLSRWYDQRSLNDMRDDVLAQSFVLGQPPKGKKTNPYLETEGNKTDIELIVIVLDCPVEISRKQNETRSNDGPKGRDIEYYEVDEINFGGREYEIDDYPGPGVRRTSVSQYMADPAGVEAYLINAGKERFPCLPDKYRKNPVKR